jgi:hypothetical protein
LWRKNALGEEWYAHHGQAGQHRADDHRYDEGGCASQNALEVDHSASIITACNLFTSLEGVAVLIAQIVAGLILTGVMNPPKRK